MIIRRADFESVLFLAQNMREWDKKEIYALMYEENPELVAAAHVGAFSYVASKDETPIAYVGATTPWPGIWTVGMFATDRFPEIGFSFTSWVTRYFMRGIYETDPNRVECKSMEGHTDAHKWLKLLKAEHEATHECYGKNGETFFTFAWTKKSQHYPFYRK